MYHVSISTCFDYTIPIERQLPLIRSAGFTYVSLCRNFEHAGILVKGGISELKRSLLSCGLSVDTIHGCELDNPDAAAVNTRLAGAAAELGAQVIVLHCSSFTFSPFELDARRSDFYAMLPDLEKAARANGVRFAFENVLPGLATDFMEEILSNTDPAYFGFCYDSSHDQIGGPRPFDLLERLSGRLIAVHISDRIKEYVDHVIPGEGFLDFEKLCSLLAGARISFPLLIEVMTAHSAYKEPAEFLSAAYQRGQTLCEKIFG
jgi:sugar phosphate isomerase/epimerase